MKINRNLDEGQLEHYASLLEMEILPVKIGSYHIVSFTGEHALKSPMEDNPETYKRFRKSLLKEFRMGIKLEEIGLNVPKVTGVYLVKGELPFLVMETRDLTNYIDLTNTEKRKFDEQYDEQMKLARKYNFVPEDVDKEFNCGFDKKDGKVIFHDFEHWRRI